jgi:hypothetical protein
MVFRFELPVYRPPEWKEFAEASRTTILITGNEMSFAFCSYKYINKQLVFHFNVTSELIFRHNPKHIDKHKCPIPLLFLAMHLVLDPF